MFMRMMIMHLDGPRSPMGRASVSNTQAPVAEQLAAPAGYAGAGNGHLDVVKYLIEKGADVHARDDYALRWTAVSHGPGQCVKHTGACCRATGRTRRVRGCGKWAFGCNASNQKIYYL